MSDNTEKSLIECDTEGCTSNFGPLNIKAHGLAAASTWNIVEAPDGTHQDFCPEHAVTGAQQ